MHAIVIFDATDGKSTRNTKDSIKFYVRRKGRVDLNKIDQSTCDRCFERESEGWSNMLSGSKGGTNMVSESEDEVDRLWLNPIDTIFWKA